MFNMPKISDKSFVAKIANKCYLKPFVPKNTKIVTD